MRWWWMGLMGLWAMPAAADIYKCLDENNRVTFKNERPIKGENCVVMARDTPGRAPAAPAAKDGGARASHPMGAKQATPADFPRVDGATQRDRDDGRRKILTQELSAEEGLLSSARKALQEAEAEQNSLPATEAAKRLKAQERAATQRDGIRQHEVNITKLRAEIAKIR